MKTPILLWVTLLCMADSCSKNASDSNNNSVYVEVIVDVTDSMIVYPEANELLLLYEFAENTKQEANFDISAITFKQLNPVFSLHIDSEKNSEKQNVTNDPNFRKKIILNFYDSVRKTIACFNSNYSDSPSMEFSECYRCICDGLRKLSLHPKSKKILICYSDLQENSDLFNAYSELQLKEVKSNPQKIANQIDSLYPLPQELCNITFYAIYDPPSREADKKFRIMCDVYRLLLEKRHAKFIVLAKNNFSND